MTIFNQGLNNLLTQVGLEFKAEEIKKNNISLALLNLKKYIKNSVSQLQEANNSSAS